jgi:hypothetical protein
LTAQQLLPTKCSPSKKKTVISNGSTLKMGGMVLRLHTGANHGMDGLTTMTGTALASLARALVMIRGPTEVDGLRTMTGMAPLENPARVPTILGPMEMMVGLSLVAGMDLLASPARALATILGPTEAAGLRTMTGTAPLASPARALRGAMTGQTVDGVDGIKAMEDGVDGAGVERAASPRAVSPRAARVDTGPGVDGPPGDHTIRHGAGAERAAREDTGRGEDGPPGDHTILSGETVDGVVGTTADGLTMDGILLGSQARAPGLLLPTAEIGLLATTIGMALASLARPPTIGMAVVTHGSTLRTITG